MPDGEAGSTVAFRSHFDERELERIDLLMGRFETLLAHGLVTRKLEKWASVVHFRATQLATTAGFGFSERELATRSRLTSRSLAAELHATLLELAAPDGTVLVADTRATWRFIATHLVLTAEIDDQPLRDACRMLTSLEHEFSEVDASRQKALKGRLEHAEAAVDAEHGRLLADHDLNRTVDRLQAALTTDPNEALLTDR